MADEEESRQRLRALADAARLPVPRLVCEDRKDDIAVAAVRGHGKRKHIVVDRSLEWLSADEQSWHLATTLGWWATPVPRRLRRLGWLISALGALIPLGLGLVDLVDIPGPPRWVAVVAVIACALFVPPAVNWLARTEARICDGAGHDILRAAGHDPAALARRVLASQADPPWHKRFFTGEPMPSRRIADADARRSLPARPLF